MNSNGKTDVDDHGAAVSIRLTRAEDGRIMAHKGEDTYPVNINACFPWSAPGSFVSLRDDDNHEVALIDDPKSLDADSQAVLAHGLNQVNFAFEIQSITVLRQEFEIRHWEVVCAQGERRFQTRRDEWPQQIEGSGLLITDVAGDVYMIPDWTRLDRQSRKLLTMYID